MNKKPKYTIIEIPASGKSGMDGGGWCFYFIYTKNHGNFILKGYMKEIKEYMQAQKITHWFGNYVIFEGGKARYNHWIFWKENIGIFSKDNYNGRWEKKFIIKRYHNSYLDIPENPYELNLKRMPHRWIPEFDKF